MAAPAPTFPLMNTAPNKPVIGLTLDHEPHALGQALEHAIERDLYGLSALDRAVDRLYRRSGFNSDRERVEHLFGLYEKMTAPLAAATKPKARRRRRPAKK